MADQAVPTRERPSQSPSVQTVPAARALASALELRGWPKMSTSPWSTTPFSSSRTEPRASSMSPLPFDQWPAGL